MSSRQLRRILHEELTLSENDDEGVDDETVVERGTAFSNAAFAFGGDTSSDDENDDENEEVHPKIQEDADTDVVNASAEEVTTSNAPQEETKKKKKKKKKRGKKKAKDAKGNKSGGHGSGKTAEKQRKTDIDDDALLDEAIHKGKMEQAQLALLKSASKQDGSSNSNVHFSSLFIDRRKLSAQSEIRRRFGSNFGSTNSASSQQNLRRRRRNKTGSASRAAKANVFVDIDDRWPTPPSRTSGEGIWMDLSDATSQVLDANCTYFSFKRGAQYTAKQHEYEALRTTHDPNQIQNFLRENPCNIDALMQMSAVYSMTQSHDGAALLMRQALYIFECSFHPKFLNCLENGTARMDLDVGMNQSFGNCIFAYALMAGRRGSRRAAYEMLKLLLILDPLRDPSSVLLCIDFYAMSSSEYKSFLDFTFISPRKFGIPPIAGNGSKNVFVPVTALPNIFFAQALSMYYLGRGKKGDSESNDVNNITYQRAKGTLTSALLRFPGMFIRILKAVKSSLLSDDDLQYENDVLLSSGLWKEEQGHPLMDKLMDIAAKKNAHEFWKAEEVQNFLIESAEEAIVHYSNNSDLYRRQKMLRSTHYGIGLGNLASSPGSRCSIYRYQSVNPAIFQDDAVTLPAMDAGAVRNEGSNSVNNSDLDLENTSTFLLFLQTLMPWNQVNPDTGRLLGGFEPPNR